MVVKRCLVKAYFCNSHLGVAESSTNRPLPSNSTSLATSASLSPSKTNLTNKRRFNSQERLLQQSDVMNTAKIAKS